jgi:hypothetical protein
MPTKEQLRTMIRDRLTEIVGTMNAALRGKGLPGLTRIIQVAGNS